MKNTVRRLLIFNDKFLSVNRRNRQYPTLGIILTGKTTFHLFLFRIIDEKTCTFRQFVFREQQIQRNSTGRTNSKSPSTCTVCQSISYTSIFRCKISDKLIGKPIGISQSVVFHGIQTKLFLQVKRRHGFK